MSEKISRKSKPVTVYIPPQTLKKVELMREDVKKDVKKGGAVSVSHVINIAIEYYFSRFTEKKLDLILERLLKDINMVHRNNVITIEFLYLFLQTYLADNPKSHDITALMKSAKTSELYIKKISEVLTKQSEGFITKYNNLDKYKHKD